jgi:hypothetical protein
MDRPIYSQNKPNGLTFVAAAGRQTSVSTAHFIGDTISLILLLPIHFENQGTKLKSVICYCHKTHHTVP